MPDHHMAHTTVLMWGSLFCLLAAWCMGKDKNYNREKKRWMLHMQLFTALFLSSEAFAWAFDGRPGKTAWWMVRISNFLLFSDFRSRPRLFQLVCRLSPDASGRAEAE